MCRSEKGDSNVFKKLTCKKCERNIGESVKQDENVCDEVETVRAFKYLGDRVSDGGGCEAAVTARTRCERVKLRECGELLYVRRFPQKLKGPVHKTSGCRYWYNWRKISSENDMYREEK